MFSSIPTQWAFWESGATEQKSCSLHGEIQNQDPHDSLKIETGVWSHPGGGSLRDVGQVEIPDLCWQQDTINVLLLCFKNEGKIPLTYVCAPLGTFWRRWAIIILIHRYHPSVRRTYETEIFALGWVPNLILNDFLLKVCQHTLHLLLVGSQSVIS